MMLRLGRVLAGVGLLFISVVISSCCRSVATDGYCDTDQDCHNAVQSWEGTSCIENVCQCPGDQQDRECGCKPVGTCNAEEGDAGAGGNGGGGYGGGGEEPVEAGSGGGGGEPIVPEPECVTAQDCKASVDAACGTVQCTGGKCALDIRVGPIDSQVDGDCQRRDCDVTGKLIPVDDPSDVYNDGKQCTYDMCAGPGMPVNEPAWQGIACPETQSGICYEDACVQCVASWGTDCPSQSASACAGFLCVPAHCVMNMDKDGDETDVNCGGSCVPCLDAFVCKVDTDCVSLNCVGNKCISPTCKDDVKNDGETGKDCGGVPSCLPCPPGEGCELPVDCTSSVCWAGKCQEPSCEDGIKNGDEIATDCGGPCAACTLP